MIHKLAAPLLFIFMAPLIVVADPAWDSCERFGGSAPIPNGEQVLTIFLNPKNVEGQFCFGSGLGSRVSLLGSTKPGSWSTFYDHATIVAWDDCAKPDHKGLSRIKVSVPPDVADRVNALLKEGKTEFTVNLNFTKQ